MRELVVKQAVVLRWWCRWSQLAKMESRNLGNYAKNGQVLDSKITNFKVYLLTSISHDKRPQLSIVGVFITLILIYPMSLA